MIIKTLITKHARSLLIVAGLLLLSLYLFITWEYPITIKTTPADSTIMINGSTMAPNNLKLSRGYYEVIVTKRGYVESKTTLEVPTDEELLINLVPEKKITYNIEPFLSRNLVETTRGLVGVDKKSGNLMLFHNNGDAETIYSGDVRIWFYNHPWVAIIDEDTRSSVSVININTGDKKTIASPTRRNVESITIDSEGKYLYLLTNSNPITRKSDLYVYDSSTNRSSILVQTNATKLEILTSNQVLLIAEADGDLLTTCTIYNLASDSSTISWQANRCLVDNTRSIALIESLDVLIYDADSQNELNTQTSGGIAWSNNRPLIIRKTSQGVIVDIYEKFEKVRSVTLPINNYLTVVGATETHITLQVVGGQIISYTIE